MTKLVLSTGNVMSSGPSFIRRSGSGSRSNLELINSLRDNFSQAKREYAPQPTNGITNGNSNGNVDGSETHSGSSTPSTPVEAWTECDGQVVYIPRVDWRDAGLREEPNQYEITVKLFLLAKTPVSEREQYIREALALVSRELRTQTIDLLVASFPGISFEGPCETQADRQNAQQGNLDDELATWTIFEKLHSQGIAKRLGVAEFGSEKLSAFIDRAVVPPAVNQINLHDCCNVPRSLKLVAEDHGIELNVHRDCTDILPPGTLRELLGSGPGGANVLADSENEGVGLQGDIVPHWAARYMAFVRDRGVIENKGYFAGADLIS